MRTAILLTIDEDVEEISALAATAKLDIVEVVKQKRPYPDPRFFLGEGKLQSVQKRISNLRVDLVLVNGMLSPSQHYRLESTLKLPVWDRVYLILNIFMMRARSREAKFQVELARLRYEIPLTKEWVNKSRRGERPGFMAGGAYDVDQYLELIKRRERKIKQELRSVKKRCENLIKSRKKRFYLVGIAGYTNAGKSTLLNKITGTAVRTGEEMFSTISTKTSHLVKDHKILVTDTVGFISNLPPWLIEAFHATLEEIFTADLILLVVDFSEDLLLIRNKISTSYNIITQNCNAPNIIVVGNKIDIADNLLEKEKIVHEIIPHASVVLVSAKKGWGIPNLISTIKFRLTERYKLKIIANKSFNLVFNAKNYIEYNGNKKILTYYLGDLEIKRVIHELKRSREKKYVEKVYLEDRINGEFLVLPLFAQK